MKKIILIGLLIIIVGFGGFVAYTLLTTTNHSPAATAKFESSTMTLSINYCRPYKKDRLIFGEEAENALIPYGKKWRTGANAATEMEISTDIMVDGNVLKKGRYSIYTIPGPQEWTVVFNENLDYWGASFSDPFDESKDILRVKGRVSSAPFEEQFLIQFEDGRTDSTKLQFIWDETMVSLPIVRL
jgi:hypothetical protein